MNKKILILGGNGFIGSHLVDLFVEAGALVRVFMRPGKQPLFAQTSGVEYAYGDFSDLPRVAEALTDIDIVVHCISTTVPTTANLSPIEDIQGNLVNTLRLLQQMAKLQMNRLVFISSGGTVYGDSTIIPIPEETGRNPLSSYGIVKNAIESYITMFSRISGLQPLVLRVSNPYGPRQGHLGVQGVIPTFFRRILNEETIRIWGDGTSVRDYIYISDLGSCIMKSVQIGLTGTYNVGSGQGTSVGDIVKIVAEITDKRPLVQYTPARGFDVRDVVLDINRISQVLSWSPKVAIEEGCSAYYNWLQNQ